MRSTKNLVLFLCTLVFAPVVVSDLSAQPIGLSSNISPGGQSSTCPGVRESLYS